MKNLRSLGTIIAATGFAVLLTGCSAPTQGGFLDKKHAKRFLACPAHQIENPRSHAFRALVTSLGDVNWVIERMSEEHFQVRARACLGNGDYLKKPIERCLVVNFIVMDNAEILAYNPADARVHSGKIPQARDWMETLERAYAELRCYSKEELGRRLAK